LNKYKYFGRDYGRGLAWIKTLIDIPHSNHGNTRSIGGTEGGLTKGVTGSSIKEHQTGIQGSELTTVLQDVDGIEEIDIATDIGCLSPITSLSI
jgi:hypothetical protein